MINKILDNIEKAINEESEVKNTSPEDNKTHFISSEKVLKEFLKIPEISTVFEKHGGDLELIGDTLNKVIRNQEREFNYKTSKKIVYFSHLMQILAFGETAEGTKDFSFFTFIYGVYKVYTKLGYLIDHSGFNPNEFMEQEKPPVPTADGNPKDTVKITDILIDLIKEEELDPKDRIVGREVELERIVQILSRRNKNNPLLVGESGTGKSSLVTGLVQRIISGDVPEDLKNTRIYSMSVGDAIAGTKFRGEFEAKIQKVLEFLKEKTKYVRIAAIQ